MLTAFTVFCWFLTVTILDLVLVPDDNTENVNNLVRIKEVERLCNLQPNEVRSEYNAVDVQIHE